MPYNGPISQDREFGHSGSPENPDLSVLLLSGPLIWILTTDRRREVSSQG
jgi:hypothetical protein